jgi:hypothetical protein
MTDLISTTEAAKLAGTSAVTIRAWAEKHQLGDRDPVTHIWKIDRDALDAFLVERRGPGTVDRSDSRMVSDLTAAEVNNALELGALRADLERAHGDLRQRDERIAALTSEINRLNTAIMALLPVYDTEPTN